MFDTFQVMPLFDTGWLQGSDDEEVLHELDVYISRSLGKLLLAQYPLRPTYKPYQNAIRESVRMRPVQCELEVDMKIQSNPNRPAQVEIWFHASADLDSDMSVCNSINNLWFFECWRNIIVCHLHSTVM
jgi:hypothetical protein